MVSKCFIQKYNEKSKIRICNWTWKIGESDMEEGFVIRLISVKVLYYRAFLKHHSSNFLQMSFRILIFFLCGFFMVKFISIVL